MSYQIRGVGKKYGDQWKREMEAKGYKVYKHLTTDNEWGYRPIRAKQGIKDVLHVWAGGNGFYGLWYYTVDKKNKGEQK